MISHPNGNGHAQDRTIYIWRDTFESRPGRVRYYWGSGNAATTGSGNADSIVSGVEELLEQGYAMVLGKNPFGEVKHLDEAEQRLFTKLKLSLVTEKIV